MADLVARVVDPRNGCWALDAPSYRVCFWNPDSNTCREFELTDAADVGAVLSWASEGAASSEEYVVYAVVPGEEVGLVRVFGRDDPC